MSCALEWLIGCSLADVEYLGHGSWRFFFGNAGEIRADCPWRIICGGGIALSSADHGHQYGLPQPIDAEAECQGLIGGAVVQSAEIRDESRDIVIVFQARGRLEIVPLSSGYESWQMSAPNGCVTIAQGGGGLAVWQPDAEQGAAADRPRDRRFSAS